MLGVKIQHKVGEDGLLYCEVCKEKAEKVINFPLCDEHGNTELRKVRINCRCEREAKESYDKRMKFEEEQRKINALRQLSLMDVKLKEVSFSNYKESDDNKKVLGIAKRYVEKFDEMYEKGQGILFWGDVGTGKSYTAAAIANELLNRQISVIMTSFIKLLKETSNLDLDQGAYIDKLNRAKLLIIDDLGAERGTDYALEKVYDIIDSRYRTGKPIILTTNLRFDDMKNCDDIRYNRIYDRIFEMCYPVKVTGMSWRKKEAVTRFDNMRKMLEG